MAGTYLLRDIEAGVDDSDPRELTAVGSFAHFSASSRGLGRRLWRTDGTRGGTRLGVDVWVGGNGSGPKQLRGFGGRLYLSALDGLGREPWVSDGSVAGTTRLADIHQDGGSDPTEFTAVGAGVFFAAYDPVRGRELWRTDGSAAGTRLVQDLAPGGFSANPRELAAFGGRPARAHRAVGGVRPVFDMLLRRRPVTADPSASRVEELLAEAIAAFDAGGDAALARFVASHPEHTAVLERGIRRCREMGLLGRAPAAPSFPERMDDFRLLRRIGGGGMGVVYEAEQMQFGRRVALKVIRPEMLFLEGARERFRREVDAIAKLAHPAIVPVLASGEHEGVPYFAMELLSGATLEEACAALREREPALLTGDDLRAVASGGAPSSDTGEAFAGSWWQVCARFAHQVALGMRHAHLRGIVHRDLKPSNVMVTAHGQAIVLDFGVAQVGAGRDLTRSGAALGSPAFMSPEQLRGEATDERTDVYSLGATLWQMLTLQRPFADAHMQEHILQGHLPSLRGRNRSVPRELELVLRTAMDRDRERRYGDMGAFANDLLAVLQRKPIAARPLGTSLRLVRWSQRHRVAATALGAALIAGTLLLGALAWQQRVANAELRAEQVRTQASLDTSLDALHSVLVRVGNERLRTVPLAEQVAHGALTDAVELYRKLLVQHPAHERVRVQGGRALHALSMSFERQGKVEDALATVREAIAVLEEDRLDRSPAQIDVRAHARMSLASTLLDSKDRTAAGPDAIAGAVAAAERDFVAAARDPRYAQEARRGRAQLRTTRSLLLDERTQPAEVEAALRQAVKLLREVVAAGGRDPKDVPMLVTHIANLAKFLERAQRDDDAQAAFEEALALAKALPAAEGVWPPPSLVVAEMQEGIGNLRARGQHPDAEGWLRTALETREAAVAQFPTNVTFRVQLGGTLHNFGVYLLRQEGRTEEALGWFERARECQERALARSPRHQQGQVFLRNHLRLIGTCQVRLRRAEEVVKVAMALAALEVTGAAVGAARLYAQAHRLQGEAGDVHLDAVVALLKTAGGRGELTTHDLEDEVFQRLHDRSEWSELRATVVGR